MKMFLALLFLIPVLAFGQETYQQEGAGELLEPYDFALEQILPDRPAFLLEEQVLGNICTLCGDQLFEARLSA